MAFLVAGMPKVQQDEGCEPDPLTQALGGFLRFIEKWTTSKRPVPQSQFSPVTDITEAVDGLRATSLGAKRIFGFHLWVSCPGCR